MKVFEKISLVYLLQIFAVVFIFGYTDSPVLKPSSVQGSRTDISASNKDSVQISEPTPYQKSFLKSSTGN